MTAADGADVRLPDVAPGEKIGDGGQGEVRAVLGQDGLLYKSYRSPEKVNGQALATLVDVRWSLPQPERDLLDAQAAWPLCRVMDGARTAGFLMKRAPATMTWKTSNGGRKLTELQFLLHPPRPQWQDIVQPATGQRRELALSLVELLDRLHGWRLVLGDVSQANVLWTVQPQPGVFLLDCDGFRAAGEPPVLAQAATVDWNDAAAPPGSATVDSDRYKAALAVGRILAQDAYAAPGTSLTLIPGELDDRQEAAVHRRFEEAAGPYGTRPALAEWRTALSPRDVIKLTAATPAPRPPINRAVLDTHRTRGKIPLQPPPP